MGGVEGLEARPHGIFGPVAADLDTIEARLRRLIDTDPEVVAAPMADLVAAGGKRIRPALVLLASKGGRCDLDKLTPAAVSVELTHAATLVHDDVIDSSAAEARQADCRRPAGRRTCDRRRRFLFRQGIRAGCAYGFA